MDFPTVRLNNGVKMPILGLGVWGISEKKCEDAVLAALKAGYRHIDTAAIYGNEGSVGDAIKKSGIPRKELFITTKLWNSSHSDVEGALNESLKLLKLDYVDLYLMHFPVVRRNQSWSVMESLYNEGKARAIGVSNFTIRHLQELIKSSKTIPAINQVEFNSYLYQKELLEFCRDKNIQLEAYSPLTHGKMLTDRKLAAIAAKYAKSPAQILIKWCLQHNLVVIPKSSRPERIVENANVLDFKISEKDMELLDSFNENLRTCWDPTNAP